LKLVPPASTNSTAHASVSINSLGPIDHLEIAATGLQPGKKYRLMLVGGSEAQVLTVLNAGIGRVAIVQTLGPLKHAVTGSQTTPAMKLELRSIDSGDLVLQQAEASL
jgi:hypothetical protein